MEVIIPNTLPEVRYPYLEAEETVDQEAQCQEYTRHTA